MWHASDFSDEQMFAIRFGSTKSCKTFMEKVEKIAAAAAILDINKFFCRIVGNVAWCTVSFGCHTH